MSKIYFCVLVVVCLGSFGFIQSLAARNSKRPKLDRVRAFSTPETIFIDDTTTGYLLDGSGYEDSGYDPNYDDDDENEGDDDEDSYDSGYGPPVELPSTSVEPSLPPSTSTATSSAITSTMRSVPSTASTLAERTVDVEPEVTKQIFSTEAGEVRKDHPGNFVPPSDDNSTSTTVVITLPNVTSSTVRPITTTTTVTVITTSPTIVSTIQTHRPTHHPTRRSTAVSRRSTTTVTPSTTTTTKPPPVKTTTTSSDDDDGDDDFDTNYDDDGIDNKLDPIIPKKEPDGDVSIDRKEEDTNEVYSNLPVKYRVSKLPTLAFVNRTGVLAGIIAGSIVALLSLILFIMFLVYRLKRKSEPAYDRTTRSPAKAGYKKALDKDMYG